LVGKPFQRRVPLVQYIQLPAEGVVPDLLQRGFLVIGTSCST